MKASEFVKENSLEATKKYLLINGWKNAAFMIELKRLVESHDLVESHGGLDAVKQYLDSKHVLCWNALDGQLSLAVADVGACQ